MYYLAPDVFVTSIQILSEIGDRSFIKNLKKQEDILAVWNNVKSYIGKDNVNMVCYGGYKCDIVVLINHVLRYFDSDTFDGINFIDPMIQLNFTANPNVNSINSTYKHIYGEPYHDSYYEFRLRFGTLSDDLASSIYEYLLRENDKTAELRAMKRMLLAHPSSCCGPSHNDIDTFLKNCKIVKYEYDNAVDFYKNANFSTLTRILIMLKEEKCSIVELIQMFQKKRSLVDDIVDCVEKCDGTDKIKVQVEQILKRHKVQ